MSAYRIYELTADDHVAAAPSIVDCPDDTAAIEKARQRLDHHIIELWRVDRCVIRMQPIAHQQAKSRDVCAANEQWQQIYATLTDSDLPTIVAFGLIGLLVALNLILRFPGMGAVIAQYNQF
jgi:hypothetical protein